VVFLVILTQITLLSMKLTDEELQEFCQIWKKAFKEELLLGEARNRALQLIELYAQLAKPLPSERKLAPSKPCDTFSTAVNPLKPKIGKFFPSNPNEKR
jgi:hypothetical protein